MNLLWKGYSIKKTWEFQRIIKNRKKVFNKEFTIFYSQYQKKKDSEEKRVSCKIGISIPQKIVKKSFLRNKYKRQIKSIITFFSKEENFLKKFLKWDMIIIIKEKFLENNFEENKEQLRKILNFLNWKENTKPKFFSKNKH